MTRTQRTPRDVMTAAQRGITEAGYAGSWGADADHLKSEEDVRSLAAAGFTFFTIDPSEHVQNEADQLTGADLEKAGEKIVQSGAFDSMEQIDALYLQRRHELAGLEPLQFSDREPLVRAVVKYGKAIAHAEKMAGWINRETVGRAVEIEISVDETDTPTSPLEHLFIALELRRRGVRPISLAPRFIGEFEKGIDYRGDLAAFESALHAHVAIARAYGPYKISVHSGSDKFRIYPIIGRVCGDLLHVKTAGTSYLEALRVIARESPRLFSQIIEYSRERFEADRATYHISAKLSDVPAPAGLSAQEREDVYLNLDAGRQILHVTFGSVLTAGKSPERRTFKEGILETLERYSDLHKELLIAHLGRHITLLSAG